MRILPTRSTLLHMRFLFSFFLLPVYVFALSEAPKVIPINALLVFVCWHLLIYPASNGYNSYFDKDEGSIALLEKPPVVDRSLYWFSLLFDLIGVLLALVISLEFALGTLIFGMLSKMYSHPAIRIKKSSVLSFLVVFVFQGAFVYWASLAAVSGNSLLTLWNKMVFVAGIVCSCLIGASYPLTQVYQHQEDAKRGDLTLSMLLGVRGSFIFSGLLFLAGVFLMFLYWNVQHKLVNFWLFLVFIFPVLAVFISWFISVLRDTSNANFRNMSRMTLVSGICMLLYFLLICVKNVLAS